MRAGSRGHNLSRVVYFMRQVGTKGPVKIGCSDSPANRLDQLSVWSPAVLEIAASFPGSFRDEMSLHTMFAESLSHHEWFRWSPELEAVIQSVLAGTFDPATLPPGKRLRTRSGWTDVSKRQQSLNARIRHVTNRSGMWLPHHACPYRAGAGSADDLAAIEAFIADPVANGIPRRSAAA